MCVTNEDNNTQLTQEQSRQHNQKKISMSILIGETNDFANGKSSSGVVSAVDLPLGDINIVVVTDVHSWVAGHGRNEPEPNSHNADYGHVLSFYQRLQQYVIEQNVDGDDDKNTNDKNQHPMDLFFFMNGDFMDGTGLSTIPPDKLTPILQHMPWDAVNLGNHELYHNGTSSLVVVTALGSALNTRAEFCTTAAHNAAKPVPRTSDGGCPRTY
jgi:2',3'-cyclic-nucleotide 2'-phosphodiesterase (5'-nucleotidase family)